MKDQELKYWTTKPNAFLVAKMNGKVVGCISYKQINQDTVEMNRLAVDSNHRGLRIGRKLVEALNATAKNEGFTTMYLETSDAQVDAWKMYEKMGFSFLRKIFWSQRLRRLPPKSPTVLRGFPFLTVRHGYC